MSSPVPPPLPQIPSTLSPVPNIVLLGITNVSADLKAQLVSVKGTAAPSAIVSTIQSTGRDAILRGSGLPNSAAVAILETHALTYGTGVRGLARMVQVAPSLTIVDLTVHGLSPGVYHASVRSCGDISGGAATTGGIWDGRKEGEKEGEAKGRFGELEVGKDGSGSVLLDRPVEVWEMIGRAFVVSRKNVEGGDEEKVEDGKDTLVGVVARSAGVWENLKTVCSCSGKNIWEERKEEVGRGLKG